MLDSKEIKGLEKKYGKHNFCYQCGNLQLEKVDDQHLWPGYCGCPKCGSSDLDAGQENVENDKMQR